jgi:hypothetical protein
MKLNPSCVARGGAHSGDPEGCPEPVRQVFASLDFPEPLSACQRVANMSRPSRPGVTGRLTRQLAACLVAGLLIGVGSLGVGAVSVIGAAPTPGPGPSSPPPPPPPHLVLSPDPGAILLGGSQQYAVEAFNSDGTSNALTGAQLLSLSIAPDGSCDQPTVVCTPSAAGDHTVTATYTDPITSQISTGSALLHVVVVPDHIVLSPGTSTVASGTSVSYVAEGFSIDGTDLGPVTPSTQISITPDGSCSGATCQASTYGTHTVTGLDGTTATATLNVVPSAPTDITAAAGDSTASISWAPTSDLGQTITAYDVVATPGPGFAEVPGTATTATIGGIALTDGTSYTFTVTALAGTIVGVPSLDSAAVMPMAGAPAPQTTVTSIPTTGGTATSDPTATVPTATNPIIADVTVPADVGGGTVTMATTTVPAGSAPAGYVFLGQQVVIVSTAATSPTSPLVLVFNIDPSQLPVSIFRDGVAIGQCTGAAGTADPSPCISSGFGTSQVTVLAASASDWDIGIQSYAFSGFFSPVDNQPTVNDAKAGSAIPVIFGLGGNQGLNVLATGYPKSQLVACNSSAPVDGIEQTVSPGTTTLSFDPASGLYQYVWKTDKAWAGTCRQLVLMLRDGTVQRASFEFH